MWQKDIEKYNVLLALWPLIVASDIQIQENAHGQIYFSTCKSSQTKNWPDADQMEDKTVNNQSNTANWTDSRRKAQC